MTTTLFLRAPERPPEAEPRVADLALQVRSRRRPGGPVVLMAAGVVLTLAALGVVATADRSRPSASAPGVTAEFRSWGVPGPGVPITISGAEQVAVHRSGFDPRESGTWHHHNGLHAVLILSGTLTVYGADCQPVRYGPGQSWIGGQGLHLTRNETDEPVEMTETVLYASRQSLQSFVVSSAPPPGCDVR